MGKVHVSQGKKRTTQEKKAYLKGALVLYCKAIRYKKSPRYLDENKVCQTGEVKS